MGNYEAEKIINEPVVAVYYGVSHDAPVQILANW